MPSPKMHCHHQTAPLYSSGHKLFHLPFARSTKSDFRAPGTRPTAHGPPACTVPYISNGPVSHTHPHAKSVVPRPHRTAASNSKAYLYDTARPPSAYSNHAHAQRTALITSTASPARNQHRQLLALDSVPVPQCTGPARGRMRMP